MKLTKIFSGIMALVMGAAVLTACSDDDDYFANTTPLLTDGAVVTGSSDVTAVSATLYGTVAGLDNMNPASYSTGFYYGTSATALTETLSANSAASFSSTISGLTENKTIYYQAFVTLQGRLTYTGEVKSLVTTDAKAITGDATDVDYAQATLAGSISKYPEGSTAGIVIAAVANQETVRAGLRLPAGLVDSYTCTKAGLLPSTTYYYAAYLDLGSSVVYGDVKSFTTSANSFDLDEFVDLGLSVKWAKRNVGAKTETDFGGLFGFGDLTGVNPSINPADYASDDTYRTAFDLPNTLYDRITLPTAADFEELFRSCTTEWTEQDGVQGYKVTGKNGNSIFLPAAGKRVGQTTSEEGEHGYYLTGSVNQSNKEFAVDYEFTAGTGVRTTRAVYEALSVRPISTARKLDKTQLYNTWHFDVRADGSTAHFAGPLFYYGTDDSWANTVDGDPAHGDSWNWSPAWGDISSWIGFAGRDYGTMTLAEDGTVTIVRIADDGTETTEEGTYTVDETNKTISLSIDILGPTALTSQASNRRTDLRILSLSDESVQIAIVRDNDPCQLSLNYAADKIYSGIAVNLLAVGSDWGGTWGSQLDMLLPQDLDGTHTVTYYGAVNGAMVTTFDLAGLKKKFPNAIVTINELKADGQPLKFDANKFFYGDIENNGNYRIEMFNIWGKGSDGSQQYVASPFSNLTYAGSDPAFTFANSLEITFTVDTQGATYTPNLITINPSWGGTWGFNQDATFQVVVNSSTGKLEVTNPTFDITYQSADHAAGSIMTFVQIDNIRRLFPDMHCTLDELKLDGTTVTGYDASKVLDSNEGDAYRLELWNMYGATNGAGCAFGTPTDGVISGLAFSNSMEVKFTIQSLFAVPEF